MTLHRRAAALIVVALVTAASPALAGSSASDLKRQATAVVQDCISHDRLTKRHAVRALKRAKRTLPADVRTYTNCERIIQRAIDRGGRPPKRGQGPDRVDAVLVACADGDLARRFAIATLRRALRQLPADLVRYTDCRAAIRQEIRRRT